jgi:hypothetical protein
MKAQTSHPSKRYIVLRGQKIALTNSTLELTIHKPLGNRFTLSDKIVDYIRRGYTARVRTGDKVITVTDKTPVLFVEKVRSKFPGILPDWARYGYSFKEESREKQMEMWR